MRLTPRLQLSAASLWIGLSPTSAPDRPMRGWITGPREDSPALAMQLITPLGVWLRCRSMTVRSRQAPTAG